jgi:dipeptidyl aminopeptidase/acylaminoacyl peptidase
LFELIFFPFAVAGNSFGGIQTVLGLEKAPYCAGVNASGAAQSWAKAPELQVIMKNAVSKSHSPIFFLQAENDYDLSPSKILSDVMKKSGKKYQLKIFPAYGKTSKDGHSFPYRGVSLWFGDAYKFINQNCKI